jgi:anti-sigma B factor antagonist
MPAGNVFEIQNDPRFSMVRFFGYVDASTVQQIRPVLQEKIPANCVNLVIDLQRVEFLDSHGVGLFVSLLKRVHGNRGHLIFAGTGGQPAAVLHMVGFNGPLVTYCDTAAQACALYK